MVDSPCWPPSAAQPPAPPGINADLIRQYAAGASEFGQQQLLTLFDFLRRSELRASALSQAYLRRIAELEAQLTEPSKDWSTPQAFKSAPRSFTHSSTQQPTHQRTAKEKPSASASTPAKAKTSAASRGPIELDLDDI